MVSSPIFSRSRTGSSWGAGSGSPTRPRKARRSPFHELPLPVLDLGRMDVEPLRQFRNRPLLPHRSHRHLRLEAGRVVPSKSSGHRALLDNVLMARNSSLSGPENLSKGWGSTSGKPVERERGRRFDDGDRPRWRGARFPTEEYVDLTVDDTGSPTEGIEYELSDDFTVTIAAEGDSGTATFLLDPIQGPVHEGNQPLSLRARRRPEAPGGVPPGLSCVWPEVDFMPNLTDH